MNSPQQNQSQEQSQKTPPALPSMPPTLLSAPNDFLQNLPKMSGALVDESRDNLLRVIHYLPLAEQALVMHACSFGDAAHINDKRKSGIPYITHPIAVAEILAGFRLDKDTLVAAILHDTVEDTHVSFEDIRAQFGAVVARLVDGVTKLKSSSMSKQESQAATFHKILTATLADPRVLIIKLSDRLHNMSTLDAVAAEKQIRTAKETLSFYVPFARVLGLNDIANYIELLCYRNLNPTMYTKFSDKLLQQGLVRQFQKVNIQTYLQKTLADLNVTGVVQVLDNRAVIYRQFFKNRGDINRLVYHYEFEIVTDTIEDCDALALHLVNTHNIGNDGIFDNIRKPLPGGNQSITLLYNADYNRIKVTLLTKRMQKAARLGIIGNDSEISHSVIQASLRNMQDLIEDDNSDRGGALGTIDELLAYLNSRKIVCYSPKGRAYELPRGATALDFAYAVGPSIGNVATGANVNDKPGKLGQVLAEGDVIEIETDRKAAPQANWLGFVATNKARKEILKGLRLLPDDLKAHHGKAALERALRTYHKSIDEIGEDDWQDILAWRGIQSQEDLFLQIANGALLPQLVVSRLFSDEVDSSDETAITRTKHLIFGVRGVEVEFARCCNPIYGDPIVGHLSKHGLSVHRHKCFSLQNIRKENPYQIIHLNWKPESGDFRHNHSLRFTVFLRIFACPTPEQISQIVYEMRALNIGVEATNIKHEARASATTTLKLIVRSRSHLQEGVDRLRHLLGYPNIMRLYHAQTQDPQTPQKNAKSA